jgi:hypothetical protein
VYTHCPLALPAAEEHGLSASSSVPGWGGAGGWGGGAGGLAAGWGDGGSTGAGVTSPCPVPGAAAVPAAPVVLGAPVAPGATAGSKAPAAPEALASGALAPWKAPAGSDGWASASRGQLRPSAQGREAQVSIKESLFIIHLKTIIPFLFKSRARIARYQNCDARTKYREALLRQRANRAGAALSSPLRAVHGDAG